LDDKNPRETEHNMAAAMTEIGSSKAGNRSSPTETLVQTVLLVPHSVREGLRALRARAVSEIDMVERANERSARVGPVKRFAILDRDLTQETEELTPTQKAKRSVIYAKFKDVIDSLYE
jgi:long-subunit acyl-CoA synthetase (AMP-forming)